MRKAIGLGVSVALTILFAVSPLHGQSKKSVQNGNKPTESEHRKGPQGLEGWTLNWPLPDGQYGDEEFAFTLILARNGHVLHRIEGSPIIWQWMFWSDGRQIAYETGPLHFSMTCILADVKTGRQVAYFDCWNYEPAKAPDWVNAMEKMP